MKLHALREADVWVEMQTCVNPGRVVYEDEHQIAAVQAGFTKLARARVRTLNRGDEMT